MRNIMLKELGFKTAGMGINIQPETPRKTGPVEGTNTLRGIIPLRRRKRFLDLPYPPTKRESKLGLY